MWASQVIRDLLFKKKKKNTQTPDKGIDISSVNASLRPLLFLVMSLVISHVSDGRSAFIVPVEGDLASEHPSDNCISPV